MFQYIPRALVTASPICFSPGEPLFTHSLNLKPPSAMIASACLILTSISSPYLLLILTSSIKQSFLIILLTSGPRWEFSSAVLFLTAVAILPAAVSPKFITMTAATFQSSFPPKPSGRMKNLLRLTSISLTSHWLNILEISPQATCSAALQFIMTPPK